MPPITLSRCACVVSAILFWSGSAAAQRPFTIDDQLKLEDVGRAVIDPTGHWLVYVRVPPYDQLPDYSIGQTGTWNTSGGRLMAIDLSSAQPTPKLLFDPDPRKVYWIDGFSPDGKSFAFYAAEGPDVTLGIYRLDSEHILTFDAAPRIDWARGHTSVWLSPTTLLYGATADGDEPSWLSFRAQTGEKLSAAWHKSWRGKEPSVGVLESHADGGGHNFLDGRLVKADAASGRLEVLARGQFEDIKASVDGRYLAALKQAELTQPDPRHASQDWINTRSELMLFDLAKGGEPTAIATWLEVFPGTLEWALDGDRLAFFAWKSGAGAQSGIFYGLDAATRTVTPYPHAGLDLASERERGWAQRPERVTWIGNRLAVLARATAPEDAPPQFTYRDITGRGPNAPPKPDWFLLDANGKKERLTGQFKDVSAVPISATPTQLFILADGSAWRIETGKVPVNLTPNVGVPLRPAGKPWGSPARLPFQSCATLEGEQNGKSVFFLVNLQASTTVAVESPSARLKFLAGSARAGAVMFREDGAEGSRLLLSRPGKPLVTIERFNTHLAKIAQNKWVTVRYRTLGAREIESCVLLPHDYQPGKRYPAIVEVYPGRTAGCTNPAVSDGYAMGGRPGSYSMHLLAAQGYVVLEATAPSGLIQTKDGPIAKLADVVLDGVNCIVDQGYADPNRVGLLGFSQGGFSSLWMATQTNRFKASVSMNGWSDLFSHYFEGTSQAYGLFYANEFPFGRGALQYESTAGTDFPIGRTPWDDPMAYVRNSAVFHAPSVTTPILMIHSDLDGFGYAQYDEMFAALYRLRKEAKYLRYWGEGHSPSSPANIRDLWNQIFAWYAKYLGPN